MVYLRKPTFWIFALAFVLYSLLIFPRYGQSFFVYDSFYNVWRARKIVENPLSIFQPDFMRRFGPLYTLFFFLMDRFFGFNPRVYGLISGSLHLLNVFLLFQLFRRLMGPSEMPAILASIFFLFSSTQWGVVWDISQIMRLACASLFLSSLLFFIRFILTKRRIDFISSWIFFLLSFGFIEDAVTLPLVLLGILFLIPPKRIPWLEKFVLVSPFFLVSLLVAWLSFSVQGPQGWGLGIGSHMFVNLLSLIRNLGQFLLIPRPEFIPFPGPLGTFLRLVPVFTVSFFAGLFWYWKRDQIQGRFLIFGITWIGITSLLYLVRPMGVWQGRYLYLPSMGEAMAVGILLYQVGKSLQAPDHRIPVGIQRFLRRGLVGIVFYGLVLNVSTTLLMADKAREGVKAATPEEIPVIFSMVSAIRDKYKAPLEMPPHMILVVEGLPFSITRLRELLPTYYISAPSMIIEAERGRPLKDFPVEKNQRILRLKWKNQNLFVDAK